MRHLTNLFKLLQVTRAQPQYGYLLGKVGKHEVSNLAEHHYLVTVIAWQLAKNLNRQGANLDVLRVVEYSLVHDLGELFGGDIGMYYARANKKAVKLAKAFEKENFSFLSRYFGEEKNYLRKLGQETINFRSIKTDEALVAKIADYLEVTHYKVYTRSFTKKDVGLVLAKLIKMSKAMKDKKATAAMQQFIKDWSKNVAQKSIDEIIEKSRNV
jgi:5'-deoxynucleotidase YfbR-like HD superfamily hydrolase